LNVLHLIVNRRMLIQVKATVNHISKRLVTSNHKSELMTSPAMLFHSCFLSMLASLPTLVFGR